MSEDPAGIDRGKHASPEPEPVIREHSSPEQKPRLTPAPGSKGGRRIPSKAINRSSGGVQSYDYTYTSSCVRASSNFLGRETGISYIPPSMNPVQVMASASRSVEHTQYVTVEYELTDARRTQVQQRRRLEGYTDVEGKGGIPFLIIGMFNGANRVPKERRINIKHPALLFWQIWWTVVQLRGFRYFLSLKDIKKFGIYQCNWVDDFHDHVETSAEDETTLSAFHYAYQSWSADKADWTFWIHESLNYDSLDPKLCPLPHALSLEVVLGWSPFRITLVVLGPVILSLVLGLWFQSRDPSDLATIQTAWGIASYVVTAGAFVAVLLGALSNVGGL